MPTVACPQCNSTNRVPQVRLTDNPNCGRCGAPLFQGRPVTLTAANFDRHANAELPLLVDFWAEWCGPCKMIAPALDEISAELNGKVKIAKVNIDENPELATRFGVRSIPTLMLFKGGEVADMKVGAAPKTALSHWINGAVA